jgi:hypothetical protein
MLEGNDQVSPSLGGWDDNSNYKIVIEVEKDNNKVSAYIQKSGLGHPNSPPPSKRLIGVLTQIRMLD